MIKLTEKQKKMLGLLNMYHRRDIRLGGPGLNGRELERMFGPKATVVRKQLEKKGLVYKKSGKWLTADWLDEWRYLPRWRYCSLQDMRRAQ